MSHDELPPKHDRTAPRPAASEDPLARPGDDLTALRARIARLEDELRDVRSERDFMFSALEHLPVGLELYDRDGLALWLNRAMVEFVGLPSAEVAVGRFNVLTDPFSVATGMLPYYRRAYAGELVRTEEFSVNLELATIDWGAAAKQIRFRMILCPRRDDAGAVERVLAIMFEVTQQDVARRIAERIIQSQGDDEAAGHVVDGLVGAMDIRLARVWREGSGGLVPAAVARTSEALTPAPDRGSLPAPEHLLAALDRGRTVVTLCEGDDEEPGSPGALATDPEASALGLQALIATPIPGPRGAIGVIEAGVSSRYVAAQAIPSLLERVAEQYAQFDARAVAQRRFETVFERSPDAMVLLSEDGAIVRRNEHARALLGTGATRCAELFTDPSSADALLRDARSTDAEQTTSWRLVTALRSDGAELTAEVACSRVVSSPIATTDGVLLVLRDLTERVRMQASLERSLHEKDTLLREVHHRVKNNLQIVSSLLALQADGLEEGPSRRTLLESVHRVRSMSLVHQQLYGSSDLGQIHLGDYARSLVGYLQSSVGVATEVAFGADEVSVPLEQAVPCGLLLNELVTNAIKHGRSPDGRSVISLSILEHRDGFSIEVGDRGPGFGGSASGRSLGVTLMKALVRQLSARMTFAPHEDGVGTRVTLWVPVASPVRQPVEAR
jgi:PAS domain S-box-containing protein